MDNKAFEDDSNSRDKPSNQHLESQTACDNKKNLNRVEIAIDKNVNVVLRQVRKNSVFRNLSRSDENLNGIIRRPVPVQTIQYKIFENSE